MKRVKKLGGKDRERKENSKEKEKEESFSWQGHQSANAHFVSK